MTYVSSVRRLKDPVLKDPRKVLALMRGVIGDLFVSVKPEACLFRQDGYDGVIPVQDTPLQDQEAEVLLKGRKPF